MGFEYNLLHILHEKDKILNMYIRPYLISRAFTSKIWGDQIVRRENTHGTPLLELVLNDGAVNKK